MAEMGLTPLAAVARALSGFNREQISHTVEVLIALMDVTDGDPDTEEDDPAGQCDEDEINTSEHFRFDGKPGDVLSDGDGDTSWSEWHTRGRLKDNPGVFTRDGRQCLEDMEDDDPAEDDDPREDDDPDHEHDGREEEHQC